MVFHNPELADLVPRGDYRPGDLGRIERALADHQTLTFSRLASGLYSASSAGDSIASSGYANVWVRDNVYVALAHQVSGETRVAVDVVRALVAFFNRYRHRFDGIISGEVDAQDVGRRPHIRFEGETLREITSERWAHAQNDALGYFLWLSCRLAASGSLEPDAETVAVLSRLVRYFEAIRFWQDEDSGHWEEVRKLSASSVGAVVGGLQAFLALTGEDAQARWRRQLGPDLQAVARELLGRGRTVLEGILPAECVFPTRNRRYDAALLFLVFPLDVIVNQAMADLILHDIDRFLAGDHGIRRYLGDSYWAPNYELHLAAQDQTRDFSDDIEARDRLLERIGDEAQWCLFDPILSAYYGRRFLRTGAPSDREKQFFHFNRSLAQITNDWRCAELYYLRNRKYTPNPHVPLQWTQANLVLALQGMRAAIRG
jgi:phosphorylase kinase alpha/beta subunit